MERVDEILGFWFGRVESTLLPSENRTRIWFCGDEDVDKEIREKFAADLEKAIQNDYDEWENDARGCLALIVLFDQFSRHIYRKTANAFAQDQKALDICLIGIEKQYDHTLSLIERTFFYLPLMHSESLEMQSISVNAFRMLIELSFTETKSMFETFLKHAIEHYEVIRQFGRFPQRNATLERASTPQELEFLKQVEQHKYTRRA